MAVPKYKLRISKLFLKISFDHTQNIKNTAWLCVHRYKSIDSLLIALILS